MNLITEVFFFFFLFLFQFFSVSLTGIQLCLQIYVAVVFLWGRNRKLLSHWMNQVWIFSEAPFANSESGIDHPLDPQRTLHFFDLEVDLGVTACPFHCTLGALLVIRLYLQNNWRVMQVELANVCGALMTAAVLANANTQAFATNYAASLWLTISKLSDSFSRGTVGCPWLSVVLEPLWCSLLVRLQIVLSSTDSTYFLLFILALCSFQNHRLLYPKLQHVHSHYFTHVGLI